MRHLSIDIETYSDTNLQTSGLYKYAQSPSFQILLIAFAWDDQPVQLFDLLQPETIPEKELQQFKRALNDPTVIKHAYNAPFEWYCLNQAGFTTSLTQWRCTMLHSLYCGYTAGLAVTGEALGLAPEKQKLSTGKALIRTFSVPQKPTKRNGQRARTLPQHEPEKWELFKEYCKQDVETEREIERTLSYFPVPDAIQAEWLLDQQINYRGVAVDRELVEQAIACSTTLTDSYMQEAREISGLENPASVAQLQAWLKDTTGLEIPNLQKATVMELLETIQDPKARRMLELRQELSKTSIKKYQAMVETAGADNRIRGLLQFYGANRTGRWAGRLVQVQNLPQTNLDMLPYARNLVKQQNIPSLELIYGSVPSALSQLIRTAIVAPTGKTLISADFSAIEARVIAWYAKEQWRLDVFATHGKIYEASASQMFGVPVELITRGNPEYELRQKGKVAELALGYGGSTAALTSMGALQMGLAEEELPDIVRRWRLANRRIVDMWYALENAAIAAVQTGRAQSSHGLVFAREGDVNGLDFLTITLPSGRKLFYARPHMGQNRWGNDSVCYWGMNQTSRKWEVTETYGGKLVENVVQATARDCLSLSMQRLDAAGYEIVFHVHDETVLEVDESTAEADLHKVCAIMGKPIPWAQGLLLKADGYISPFYKKD